MKEAAEYGLTEASLRLRYGLQRIGNTMTASAVTSGAVGLILMISEMRFNRATGWALFATIFFSYLYTFAFYPSLIIVTNQPKVKANNPDAANKKGDDSFDELDDEAARNASLNISVAPDVAADIPEDGEEAPKRQSLKVAKEGEGDAADNVENATSREDTDTVDV